jgi:hypothetical protein
MNRRSGDFSRLFEIADSNGIHIMFIEVIDGDRANNTGFTNIGGGMKEAFLVLRSEGKGED